MIERIIPDFPSDRKVIETADKEKWYRINYCERALYVPTNLILRSNPNEIDKMTEAVMAFANLDNLDREVRWDQSLEFTLNYLMRYKGLLSCDIECKQIEYEGNEMLAIGFAGELKDGREFTVTVTDFSPANVDKLKYVFEKIDIKFVWHNGKFDTTRLKYMLGIDARVDEDTILMHFAGINEKKGTHSLKDLGQLYLQAPKWDDELQAFKKEWCRKNKVKLGDFTYDLIPTETLLPYLKLDCLSTLRLCKLFSRVMREDSWFIYRKLTEASNVYRDIELAGVEHNLEWSEIVAAQLEGDRDEAEKEMEEVIKEVWDPSRYMEMTGAKLPKKNLEFNPGSPKQLKWLLSQLLGKEVTKTDKAALEELSEHVEDIDSELGRKFLIAISKKRKADKYYDTYVLGLRSQTCSDNRIRCSFNLYGTETGRLSSSEPNMQNIPRNKLIKNLLMARPGYKLVQLDYSQAELRVLTFLSDDPTLKNVYLEGRDLHDEMALKVHGPGFTKEQRVIIKSLNFGIAYGRGPGSISQMFKMSMDDARKVIRDWYAQVPLVEKFIKSKRDEPLKGITPKTPFGRERHFIITNENVYHVQNESINFYIQSIASDLTMFSVIEIHQKLNRLGLDARIVNTVHDSIIIETRDEPELIKQVAKLGTEIMRKVPIRYLDCTSIPFKADVEVGTQWGEMEKYEDC